LVGVGFDGSSLGSGALSDGVTSPVLGSCDGE
jgi:hypothetical protein